MRYLRENIKYHLRRRGTGRPGAVLSVCGGNRRGAVFGRPPVLLMPANPANITRLVEQGIRQAPGVDAAEALELYRSAPTAVLGAPGRRHPRAQASRAARHLHHRPQRQLHERLRGEVQLLRVLPGSWIAGRLRARVRRAVSQDRRDDRGRRRAAAAAGRPQSRPPAVVVRGSVPGGQGAVSVVQAPRAVAARSHPPVAPDPAAGARGDRPADRGGTRQHSRRRRRNPRRSRAQAPALLRQGHRRTNGSTSCATRIARACARRRR